METINWGIIGCGKVCEKKSGPAFYKINHSALTAVMRRDAAKAEDFAKRHGVPKYYTDAEQLINDPDINAIYVATPPYLHKKYAIMAMEAGKPVYVEKPMAMNYEECKEMITVSEKTGQKLFTAFYRRGLPYFLKVKSLLEEKAIGNILSVNVVYYEAPKETDAFPDKRTWHLTKEIAGDGYFYDLAPHTLDILDYLLGEITDATGYIQNLGHLYEVTDTVSAIFRFKSGAIGTGQWCFVTPKEAEQDSIEIIGDKGKICLSTFAFTPIQLISETKTELYEIAPPEHIQQPLIQTIVNELRGIGTCPSTGISGSRTSRVMDWIMKGTIYQ